MIFDLNIAAIFLVQRSRVEVMLFFEHCLFFEIGNNFTSKPGLTYVSNFCFWKKNSVSEDHSRQYRLTHSLISLKTGGVSRRESCALLMRSGATPVTTV